MDREVWRAVRRPESYTRRPVSPRSSTVVIVELRSVAGTGRGRLVRRLERARSVGVAPSLVPFAGIAFLVHRRRPVARQRRGTASSGFPRLRAASSRPCSRPAAALTTVLRLDGVVTVTPETSAAAMAFGSALLSQFGTRMAAVLTLT